MRDEAIVAALLSLLKEQATTEIEVALIKEFTQQLEKTLGEIWRDIEGHEGNYQISNYGRVKSFKGKKPRILSTCKDSKGYPKATFTEDGKPKTYLIHVLVARAFIPNPDNLPVVHHKDGNPKNNRVDNLMWVTYKQNLQYAYDSGRKKPPSGRKKHS